MTRRRARAEGRDLVGSRIASYERGAFGVSMRARRLFDAQVQPGFRPASESSRATFATDSISVRAPFRDLIRQAGVMDGQAKSRRTRKKPSVQSS
jgi:hypothetical protein